MADYLVNIRLWVGNHYSRIVNSIAFYPAFISLLFLTLSVGIIWFDFSETGKELKSGLPWLSLKDASTARNIIVVIAGGIISLTVFSFSMVMIVLNQAASNMSNRVLNKLIGNRFQQVILGIYIGTIMYALFLLSTIREIDSGIYVPAISVYILIIIAVVDIFLFIYFLHYITQSVKYEVIINRIHDETHNALKNTCYLKKETKYTAPEKGYTIKAPASGIYKGFESEKMIDITQEYGFVVNVMYPAGSYVLEGVPLFTLSITPQEDVVKQIQGLIYIGNDETIEDNFMYGFKQLTEIALKALSPGINDPGTAALVLRALFDLFSYRICFFPESIVKNEKGIAKIFITQPDFDTIFEESVLPIWDYGKNDRILKNELHRLLKQFLSLNKNERMEKLFAEVTYSL